MNHFFKKLVNIVILAAIDTSVIIVAFVFAISLRDFIGNFVSIPNLTTQNPITYVVNDWWVIPLYLVVFFFQGLYHKHRPFWQETKVLFQSIILTSLLVYAFISLGQIEEYISRILFVLHPMFIALILPLARRFIKSLNFSLGFWRDPLIELQIDTDYSLVTSFSTNTFLGYEVVHSEKITVNDKFNNQVIEKIKNLTNKYKTKSILVVVNDITSKKVFELIERLYFVVEHVLVVPELLDLDVLNADVYHLMYENLFIFNINKGLNTPINRLIKRLIDIIFSSIGIIAFGPVMIAIALLVYVRDGFPIFYDHKRFGLGGKIFTFHKFRSMKNENYPDENYKVIKEYLKNHPEQQEEWDKYQKLDDDPRVLKGMNIIRKTSVDELAQLFNVLKGEMSIVGPRPFMLREKEMLGDCFERVLAAKPGITDLWTVSGRNSLSFDKRVQMSIWYIQNWSLWLDFVIIAKTIQQVISYFLRWLKGSRKQSENT